MSSNINIKYFFDFLSPFSFFAWLNLNENLCKSFPDAVIEAHPLPMGKLFSTHNFPGPGEIPAKRDYELKKCFRYAAQNQIDFKPPKTFPFNPLAILRAATTHAAGEHQTEVIDIIFKAIWQKSMVLDDPELIGDLLNGQFPEIVDRSFSKEARTEIRQNIQMALDAGAFGVPSMVFKDELFWGNDEIKALSLAMEGNDNWDREYYDDLVVKK